LNASAMRYASTTRRRPDGFMFRFSRAVLAAIIEEMRRIVAPLKREYAPHCLRETTLDR